MESDPNTAERNLAARLTNNSKLRELLNQKVYLELKPKTFWGLDLLDYIPKVEIVHSEGKCHLDANVGDLGIFDLLGYYDAGTQTINICEQNIFHYLKNNWESDRKDLSDHGFNIDETGFFASLREVIRLHEHAHAIIDSCGFNCFSAPSHEWFVSLPDEVGEPLAQFIVWSLLNTKDDGKSLLMETFKLLSSKQSKIYQDWKDLRDCFDPLPKAMGEVIDYRSLIPLIVRFSRTKNKWESFDEFKGEMSGLGPEALAFSIQSEAQRKVEYLKSFLSEESDTQEKDENVD